MISFELDLLYRVYCDEIEKKKLYLKRFKQNSLY